MSKKNGAALAMPNRLQELPPEPVPMKPKRGGFGKKPVAETASITIPKPDVRTLRVRIVGDTPLISHKFSEKNINMIEDKQQQKAKQPKGPRNPKEEFEASRQRMPDGSDGFPAGGFKLAIIEACSFVDGMVKKISKGGLFVLGEQNTNLVKINYVGKGPRMGTDHVRINNGRSGDVRYRPYYDKWWCDLVIRYNALVVGAEQIINLIANAGFSIGVGDWRPGAPFKPGTFGMWHVADEKESKGNPFK